MMLSRVALVAGSVALMSGTLVAIAPAAQAGECAKQTGGNNNRVMWTGSGYTCAYTADNGDNKIGAFATEVWTSSTAPGYEKRFKCQRNSGGVSISSVYTNSGGTSVGSSITFTAFNTKDGSRHWTGAVLWNTPKGGEGASSQFRDNCDGYTVKSNLFYVPKVSLTGPTYVDSGANGSYEVTVTTPDGGGPAAGAVTLFHQASVDQKSPNPPGRGCDGTSRPTSDVMVGQATLVDGKATISNHWYGPSQYKLYAVFGGQPLVSGGLPAYCAAPPVSGLTAGISNVVSLSSGIRSAAASRDAAGADVQQRGDVVSGKARIKVVNSSSLAPALPVANCPVKWAPMQANISSPTAVIAEGDVQWTPNGAGIRDGAIPVGTQINLQTVCRPSNAQPLTVAGNSYGSRWADDLTSQRQRSVMFGGMGDDQLMVMDSKTLALGGRGSDAITVAAKGSAANGGPGQDTVIARTRGLSLIVGGAGRDRLVGAAGAATRINAADGLPGDRVVCRGSRNRVLADPGDRLIGSCVVVTPSS
jgi:hypothetical protein